MKELRFVLLEVAGNDLGGAKAIIRVLDAFERKKRIKYGSSSRSYGSEVDNLDAIIMIKNFNQNPLNLLACLVQGHGRNGKRVGQHVANQLVSSQRIYETLDEYLTGAQPFAGISRLLAPRFYLLS